MVWFYVETYYMSHINYGLTVSCMTKFLIVIVRVCFVLNTFFRVHINLNITFFDIFFVKYLLRVFLLLDKNETALKINKLTTK